MTTDKSEVEKAAEDEFVKYIRRQILATMGQDKDAVIKKRGDLIIEGYNIQQVEIDMCHNALRCAQAQIRELQSILHGDGND